jgi:tartrate-resistant acid phosphatase type 5
MRSAPACLVFLGLLACAPVEPLVEVGAADAGATAPRDDAAGADAAPMAEDAGTSPDAGTSLDAGASADAGASPDAEPAADASPAPDAAPAPEDAGSAPDSGPSRVVRFVALGDTGEGNTAQYEVGRAFDTVCMVQGCDFVLLLGDNFYDRGVDSPEDDQFRTKFEEPYAGIQLPFYVTLGNHDFGQIPVQFWRTDHQIEYSGRSARWNMPDHFYELVREHVTFISLDTNMIMLGLAWVRDQRDWVRERIAQATTPWIVAYGHHPYRSNGSHGNAGNFEGAGRIDPTGLVSGRTLKSFFEDELCGNVDVYLSGHDHTRQWLEPACDVELIVSGAGAKTTDLERRDGNPMKFEDDATEGFFWIEIADDVMTVEIWDRQGNLSYTGTQTRRP